MKKNMMIGILWVVLTACNSNPNGYKIQGKIANAGNGIAILTEAIEKGKNLSDTVGMKNGVFTFSGKLKTPTEIRIQIISHGKGAAYLGLIAENTQIKVTADWNDVTSQHNYCHFSRVKVEGSRNHDVNEMLSEVRKEMLNKPEFKEYAVRQKQLDGLYNTDKEAYEKLKEALVKEKEHFMSVVHARQLQLIRENRDVESVAVTLQFLMMNMSLEELEEIFYFLAPNVQASPMAAEIRKEIETLRQVQPGMPAPEIAKEDINGNVIALSDLQGKYVVLDFWASWCQPCRKSFHHVKELYKKYHEQGFEVFCVADDDRNPKAWKKAIEDDKTDMFYHVLRGMHSYTDKNGHFCMDHSNDINTHYAIHYLPTKYLINPEGKIVGKFDDAGLEQELDKIFK